MEIAGRRRRRRRRRKDRISKLGDVALGRILSFLPGKEAARAALLSSRWRHAFAGVDAVTLEEPEEPYRDYDSDSSWSNCDNNDSTPRFSKGVTSALFARHRLPGAPPPPLRALRVALGSYSHGDASAVDQWVSYALSYAAPPPAGLELVLRLDREPVCSRRCRLRPGRSKVDYASFSFYGPPDDAPRSPSGSVPGGAVVEEAAQAKTSHKRSRSSSSSSSSDESSSEEDASHRAMPRRRMEADESETSEEGSSSEDDESDGNDHQTQPSPDRDDTTSSNSASGQQLELDQSESSDSSSSDDSEAEAPAIPSVELSSVGHEHRSPSPPPGEDDDVVSDEPGPTPPPMPPCQQARQSSIVPGRLFSSAALRSLSIGPCSLSPPAIISLPSLEELLLIRVSDQEGDVQRLITACPRLGDLTLEGCLTVTELSLLGNRRLRRLSLQCCHRLANVVVDDRLQFFGYRGAVPETSLLTVHGEAGGGVSRFMSCKVDICGKEVSSAEELTKLREFLQLLASTEHLHLQSPRLGAGVDHEALARFPAFTRLLNLELTGCLPHEDDGVAAVAAVSRILRHAPSVEVISLVFHTVPGHDEYPYPNEPEFLDAHQLGYNKHEVLAAPAVNIPCLRNRLRKINLVNYQGGRAQRTLAKFLLCNAPVLKKLYCGFARGAWWVQTELKDEMQGWAMNKPESRVFS